MAEYNNGEKKENIVGNINTFANIDASKIASEIFKLIKSDLNTRLVKDDSFDNSESFKKIAEAMIIQRNDNKSNINKLNNVVESKSEDSNDIIDLLKGLE